jgi:hypothetical protein
MIFERCRKYGISLNLKKRIFVVSEGKFIGHIISKDGISMLIQNILNHHANSLSQQQEINAVIFWKDQFSCGDLCPILQK